jgi:hypothetical protein
MVAPGNLPGFLNGTKAQPRATARGAPKMRPLASNPVREQKVGSLRNLLKLDVYIV